MKQEDMKQSPYFPEIFSRSGLTTMVLGQLGQTACNISSGVEIWPEFNQPTGIVIGIQRATTKLLWHPGTFLIELFLSTWSAIVKAPPLFQIVFAYLVVRKLVLWTLNEYQEYLDLGRGGTPSNFWGWWRVTRLHFMAGVDVLDPPHIPPMLEPYRGLLWHLPRRKGTRPIVKGVAPQRQFDQRTPISTFNQLIEMITAIAKANEDMLTVKISTLERHTLSLTARRMGPVELPDTEGEFGHEICHPHKNDGSIHLIMHPEDIKTVIEAGWGQRHPLSTNKWYWKWWYHHIRHTRMPVPEYLVLVYAPRNDEEISVVEKLVQAAVWFKTKKIPRGYVDKSGGKQSPNRARGKSKKFHEIAFT